MLNDEALLKFSFSLWAIAHLLFKLALVEISSLTFTWHTSTAASDKPNEIYLKRNEFKRFLVHLNQTR